MKGTLTSIVAAIKILRNEGSESPAVGILEDALKQLCKLYIMDMSEMSTVIGFEEVKQELINGLKLVEITARSDESP